MWVLILTKKMLIIFNKNERAAKTRIEFKKEKRHSKGKLTKAKKIRKQGESGPEKKATIESDSKNP